MTTDAASTFIAPNACDACDGEYQKPYEPLKYSGRHRDWLCASCWSALLSPDSPTRQDVPCPS